MKGFATAFRVGFRPVTDGIHAGLLNHAGYRNHAGFMFIGIIHHIIRIPGYALRFSAKLVSESPKLWIDIVARYLIVPEV
jgi:hypothetical protein